LGARKDEFLRCPWHGWEFEISTGQSWCDPKNLKIRQFPVAVERGRELVKGPYSAETFPVAIEQRYVIIEM
jgi:nitrite reductase/ring-hydroxylating ferredoxin subunit